MSQNFFKMAALVLSCSALASCTSSQVSSALSSAMTGQQTSSTTTSTGNTTSAVSSANVTSLISNLISSVTGNATTTQTSILGTWTYSEPCVQFESSNLLTQAGGATLATSTEQKLAQYYQMVGIKAGKMVFTFASDGSVTYKIGSMQRQGTYVFDSSSKTITITTAMGQKVKAYVTVSGIEMALTFEANKLLSLLTSAGQKVQQLQAISTLAANYDGMKVGFKFKK